MQICKCFFNKFKFIIAEEDKAKWLEEKGYTEEDFEDDVLDNGEETRYSLIEKKFTESDYETLKSKVMTKNSEHRGRYPIDYDTTANHFVVCKNNGYNNIKVIKAFDIDVYYDVLSKLEENIKNGKIYRDAKSLRTDISRFRNAKRRNSDSNVVVAERKSNGKDGGLYRIKSQIDTKQNNRKSSGNKQNLKFSLKTNEDNKFNNSNSVRYSYKSARYINRSLTIPTLSYIRNELRKIYGNENNAIADGIAIEQGNVIYIVDSGIDNGIIDFGVRTSKTISNEKLRKEYLWRKNDESIRKGYVSDGLSSNFGNEYVDSWNGYRRYKSRKELQTNNGKSTNHESTISKANGNDRGNGLKFSYISQKDSKGNTLSKEQEEFFKDSKVRNDKGELEVVYHGTIGEFHTFDKTYLKCRIYEFVKCCYCS